MMKTRLKNILRNHNWSFANTKYRWGIDLYSDIRKISGKPLTTAVDIGANEGVFANELLDALHLKKLYSIEPGSNAYKKLSMRFEGDERVQCDKYAIGEEAGTFVLYTFTDSKKNTLDPSLRDQMRTSGGTPEEITVITLNEYASRNSIKKIDFLKIDVEGNELPVLKGATDLLANGNISFIFCEFHKIMAFENNASQHTNLTSLVEFLYQFNYRFIALYTQGVHLHEDLVTCNVLFADKNLINSK